MLRRRLHSHAHAARNGGSSPSTTMVKLHEPRPGGMPHFMPIVAVGLMVLATYSYFSGDALFLHASVDLLSGAASTEPLPISKHSLCPQVEPLTPVVNGRLSQDINAYLSSNEGKGWIIDSLSLAVRTP